VNFAFFKVAKQHSLKKAYVNFFKTMSSSPNYEKGNNQQKHQADIMHTNTLQPTPILLFSLSGPTRLTVKTCQLEKTNKWYLVHLKIRRYRLQHSTFTEFYSINK